MSSGCETCVISQCKDNPGVVPEKIMTLYAEMTPADEENISPAEQEKIDKTLETPVCEVEGCDVTLGGIVRVFTSSVGDVTARQEALQQIDATVAPGCIMFEPENRNW